MAKPKFVTPIGTVKFPYIAEPDKRGKWSIALVLEPKLKEFGDLIAQLDAAEKDFEKKYRGKPHYKKNIEIVDGEKQETDKVMMQFKSAYPLFDDKDSKIFDSLGNKVKTDIGWGSKCRVSFVLSPYDQDGNIGITRYISGIQIIELKLPGARAESCGFKEEKGYISEEKDKMTDEEKNKAIAEDQIAWDE